MRRKKFTEARYSIYCYTCPLTGEIFYVGQDTKHGRRGAATHEHNHGLVQDKLNSLFALGLEPVITRLCQFDTTDRADLNRAEIYWIALGRALGWPLLNLTDGGDVTFGWKCYEATKLKISIANTGKKRTPEQCKRNGDAHRGIRPSAETLAKRSASLKGKPKTPEHIAAVRAARDKWSPEFAAQVFEKVAASKRGKPRDAETRAKLSKALKGKPWSEARRRACRQK